MDEMEKMKEMPPFITKNDDGKYIVTSNGKEYIMEEQSGAVMEKCQRLADKTNTNMETLLAVKSLVEPKLTDSEFMDLPGSTFTKIRLAVVYIYGLNDFL